MKKIISFILSLAMVTTLSFTLTACGECEHTLGDWSVTKDATCQVKGSKQKVCTKCGEVVENEEIVGVNIYRLERYNNGGKGVISTNFVI